MIQIKTTIKNYVMKFILCLFILITLFDKAYSQDNVFRQMSDNTFMYNGRIGKLHTFKDVILLDSINLYSDFNNFNINRKNQIKMNIISVAVGMPIIYLGYELYTSGNDIADVLGRFYTSIGISVAGIGIGLSSGSYGHAKNKYKKSLLAKAINRRKETGYLRVETTESGIGLVYRF
jgi:hypothetical protein